MKQTRSGRAEQVQENSPVYGGRKPGEPGKDHLRRIALRPTYPLINNVAAEVLALLDRLKTMEARLSALEAGKPA
jgi:hypothetical protein